MRWLLFLFYYNWFFNTIIKRVYRGINVRIIRFKNLRTYTIDTHRSFKSHYLIICIKSFFNNLIADNPQILEYDLDTPNPQYKKAFKDLITNYINKRNFDQIYSYIARYINYKEIFRDRRSLI